MVRWLTLTSLLLLLGCAHLTPEVPQGISDVAAGQLPFPAHETSDLTEYILAGSATEFRSAGASDFGSTLVLDGVTSGFEYGVYRFNLLGEAPDSVSVLLEEFATSGAWIGVANYTTNRWDFSGPFIKQKSIVIDDPTYVSPADNIWVAVVAASNTATVNALSVRTIKPNNQPPVADLSVDNNSGNTPLTVQFDAGLSNDPDGNIIEYAWDFDGDGLYEAFSDESSATHVFTSPGLYTVKLRVTDDQFARASDTVDINANVVGNSFPQVVLTANPDDGESPYFVSLDASGSSDPDGSIVVYDWDYTGDGLWDDYNAGPFSSYVFSVVGINTAKVRVTDNAGAQTIGSVQVTVQGWQPAQLLGDVGTFGTYCSLLAVNGIPAIAYYDGALQDLMFKKAMDPYGDGWNVPQSIDSTGNVGIHTSMAIVNGNPAVAYYDNTNAKLKYVRSSDIDGVNWNAPLTLDNGAVVGVFNSLAVVNGNPAISYYVFSGNDLKYVRATDPDGTAWSAPIIVDSTGDVGQHTSLAVVNGQPAISYYGVTTGDLKYVQATDADGVAWGPPVTVDSTGNVGQYTSMEIVNGWPAISYHDASNLDLKYVRALDPDGLSWDIPLTLDSAGNEGAYNSLAIVNGVPAIAYSYFDVMSQADLKYIAAVDPDGASWNMPLVLDTPASVGYYPSLAEINGKAMVAFEDYTNQDLKFVRRY